MALLKKLSVIIPVYNEETTIALLIRKVLSVSLINNIEKEIIIVNDCDFLYINKCSFYITFSISSNWHFRNRSS